MMVWPSWGVNHFCGIFREQRESLIVEIIQITQLLPWFLEDEENEDLMAEVSDGELLVVLHSF